MRAGLWDWNMQSATAAFAPTCHPHMLCITLETGTAPAPRCRIYLTAALGVMQPLCAFTALLMLTAALRWACQACSQRSCVTCAARHGP